MSFPIAFVVVVTSTGAWIQVRQTLSGGHRTPVGTVAFRYRDDSRHALVETEPCTNLGVRAETMKARSRMQFKRFEVNSKESNP